MSIIDTSDEYICTYINDINNDTIYIYNLMYSEYIPSFSVCYNILLNANSPYVNFICENNICSTLEQNIMNAIKLFVETQLTITDAQYNILNLYLESLSINCNEKNNMFMIVCKLYDECCIEKIKELLSVHMGIDYGLDEYLDDYIKNILNKNK